MYSKNEAYEYMRNVRNALGTKLIEPEGIYAGREGHLRLARECGVALADFDEIGRNEILKGSYGSIYVIGCRLKPILDAKEWINEMRLGWVKGKMQRQNRAYDRANDLLKEEGLFIGGRGLGEKYNYKDYFPVFRISEIPHGFLIGYIDADCSQDSVRLIIERSKTK